MRWVGGYYVRMDRLWLGAADFVTFVLIMSLTESLFVVDADESFLNKVIYLVALPASFMAIVLCCLGIYEPAAQNTPSLLLERLLGSIMLGGLGIDAIYRCILGTSEALVLASVTTALSLFAIAASRFMLHYGILPDALKTKVLVLGVGRRAEQLWGLVADSKEINICGFVQVEFREIEISEVLPQERIVPPINSLSDYAVQYGITAIVIALDDRRGALPMSELISCRLRGIHVMDCTSFIEHTVQKLDLQNLHPSGLIFSDGFCCDILTVVVKRLFDIFVSILFLVLALPVLVLTMIAIKLESPGPVFYRQRRVGLHGHIFEIIKFRSMKTGAEKDGKARWATPNDPRVTRVGAFIRKTHIDEIPQAINVLFGTMSFVGPRPERPDFVTLLSEEIEYYSERHNVRPGITGWAQVNYSYGNSVEDAREKLTYDLYYMKNFNIVLDLIILLKSVWTTLTAKRAW